MKVLVLGGAGYIGSHTVYELIDHSVQVVVIDNLETGYLKAVHPAAVVAPSERARKILGWKPQQSSLEGIIQSAWRWHTSHPCGYQ